MLEGYSRSMRAATRFALLAVAASLAACGGGTAEPAATPSPSSHATGPSPASTAEHAPSPSPSPADEGTEAPQAHLEAIHADLDSRGIDGSRATVTQARSVTWQNGSLGCGEPGATYTQAQVPGWQVIVEVDGTSYDYRFGRDTTPILCERPSLPQISHSDI